MEISYSLFTRSDNENSNFVSTNFYRFINKLLLFSRPLPIKAQPMPTPMVTMVNKMGTA